MLPSHPPLHFRRFPLPKGVPGREVTWGRANRTIVGVLFDQNRQYEEGSMTNLLSNTTFSSFDNTCHVSAAVAVGQNRASFWNAGHGFQSLRFSNTTKTNKLYLFPKTFPWPGSDWVDYAGEVAKYYALRDFDGSIIGAPGYAVANNPSILPPASFSPGCTFMAAANAYACKGTCYRTVQVRCGDVRYLSNVARRLELHTCADAVQYGATVW